MIWLTRLFIAIHVFLYRFTGGKVGAKMGGNAILLLTSVGRKTGKRRTTPLVFFRDGVRYVITASNGGASRHPGWYFNLRHQAQTTIAVRGEVLPVRATLASGAEYVRLWSQLTADHPQFTAYQQKTSRQIPLFILTPIS